jgi:hypothetical protein
VLPERGVRHDHPLRPIRAMVDAVLKELSPRFARLYAQTGRPSIPPEKLLRALLLQVLYSVRSERQLIEQLDYNLPFRWSGPGSTAIRAHDMRDIYDHAVPIPSDKTSKDAIEFLDQIAQLVEEAVTSNGGLLV